MDWAHEPMGSLSHRTWSSSYKGPGAMNPSKRLLEGGFDPEKLCWGIYMHFKEKTQRLPEPKCLRGKYLLELGDMQSGCRQVRVKIVQEVRGSALLKLWREPQGPSCSWKMVSSYPLANTEQICSHPQRTEKTKKKRL